MRSSIHDGTPHADSISRSPQRGAARGLHRQPAIGRLGADPRRLRRRRLLRRLAGAAGAEAAARRHRGGADRRRRGLQDRPDVAVAHGLLEAGRRVRPRRRHLRHPVVQHHDLDGATHAQHPAQLRPVRARSPPSASATRSGRRGGRASSWAATSRSATSSGIGSWWWTSRRRDRARIFERFVRIGSATVLARELRERGRAHQARQAVDKGYLYKLLNNRTYLGLAVHKGTAYPGRARSDHRPGAVGQGARDPRRERPHPIRAHPGADAGAAEGADLRADRRSDVADAHPEGQPALPLLRQPGRAEARAGCLPGRSGGGGGDRGGGDRPAARRVPAAGDHRRHLARGAGRAGRHHRGRGAGGARCSSTRCGTSSSRPSRRGSCSCWSSGSTCGCTASRSGCGRTGSPGWCARWRAAGGRRHDAGDGLGGRRDDHRPHPAHVQEARRAEAGGDAGRRAVGAAAARRQRHGQGAGAGVPVAEDAGRRACTRRSRTWRGPRA